MFPRPKNYYCVDPWLTRSQFSLASQDHENLLYKHDSSSISADSVTFVISFGPVETEEFKPERLIYSVRCSYGAPVMNNVYQQNHFKTT